MELDFHSYIIIKANDEMDKINMFEFMNSFFILVIGVIITTSNSRIKNINKNIRKLIEIEFLNLFILLKPHSKGLKKFLFVFFFLKVNNGMTERRIISNRVAKVFFNISF